MRVALLGWDLDHAVATALGGLGVEVVGVTRWFPDRPTRESHPGWLEARCPHEIGGAARDEALAFGVAVVREASSSGLGFEFDVVHALDWRTRPAAGELAARGRGVAVLGSDVAAEEEGEAEDVGFGPRRDPDGWICDHPLRGDRLSGELGRSVPVFTIPERRALARRTDRAGSGPDAPDEGPCLALSPRVAARLAPGTLIETVRIAREKAPGLVVVAHGSGPRPERLRGRLKRRGLLSRRWSDLHASSAEDWNETVARAAAVGVLSFDPIEDPYCLSSGLVGAAAVPLLGRDAEGAGRALVDALFDPRRRDRDARAAEVLTERWVDPARVAEQWLRVYLRLLNGERSGSTASARPPVESRRGPQPLAFPELRTRLTMTPIASREVLASWSLRPDDWRAALEWLGPESIRAVLTIRVFDASDPRFDGGNAHGFFDVDLGPGETHRAITLPEAGRSLAACLGVRSPWGYFHPLAHARLCHPPKEAPTPPPAPPRRLRVLPRRPRH